MEDFIIERIKTTFKDAYVEAYDAKGGDHFEVLAVTNEFVGKKLIDRHRMIMDLFKEELKSKFHAFSLITKTFDEFENK